MLTCADGTIYTGYTVNLSKRIKQHNSTKQGARYTRTRRPVKLSYYELYSSRKKAMRRERELKGLKREEKISMINQFRSKLLSPETKKLLDNFKKTKKEE
jgi:putative endonuclease